MSWPQFDFVHFVIGYFNALFVCFFDSSRGDLKTGRCCRCSDVFQHGLKAFEGPAFPVSTNLAE